MGLSDKLDNVMDMIEHSQLSREPRRMSLMVKIAGLALLLALITGCATTSPAEEDHYAWCGLDPEAMAEPDTICMDGDR